MAARESREGGKRGDRLRHRDVDRARRGDRGEGVHRIVAARHPQPDVVTITGEMDGEAAAVGARLEIAAAYRCCVRNNAAKDIATLEKRRGFWIFGVGARKGGG